MRGSFFFVRFQYLLLNARQDIPLARGSENLYFSGRTMKLCVTVRRSVTIVQGPSRWCCYVLNAWLTPVELVLV